MSLNTRIFSRQKRSILLVKPSSLMSACICLRAVVFRLTQTVAVVRRDKASRQKVIDELKTRVQSEGVWPQLILFPEGTTTNRQALITFKPGAFIPGMPVQPVVIRYPDAWVTELHIWYYLYSVLSVVDLTSLV